MYAKLQTEEGRKTYHRRMHVGETPFAIIKGILAVRRFLLRGLEKVRTEWRWVCTAYNLRKLLTTLAALRKRRNSAGQPERIGDPGWLCAGDWPPPQKYPLRTHDPTEKGDAASRALAKRNVVVPRIFTVSRKSS